jgi:acyl-CoA thioester hydrolase
MRTCHWARSRGFTRAAVLTKPSCRSNRTARGQIDAKSIAAGGPPALAVARLSLVQPTLARDDADSIQPRTLAMSLTTRIPAPFERFEGEVLPEWIDYNGHMNLAYYVVLFDQATDLLFDELDLGLDYRRSTGKGTFVVEAHTVYENELLAGARVRIATQILGSDDKRLHLAHEMFAVDGGARAAAQELMFLHVDLMVRRVCPFLPELRARVAAWTAAHAALPRPSWVGRRIAMPG